MTTATTPSIETQVPAQAAARKPRAPRPPPVSVTQAAVERVRALLAKRGKPSFGVRVGVRTRGCSGLSYTLEYADAAEPGDEVIRPTDDVTILIAPKAAMFLFGTEMDFVEENLKSGFTFRNPNEKGRCGCGESFHI
jgi:iron-sulfur cluster assembly protein